MPCFHTMTCFDHSCDHGVPMTCLRKACYEQCLFCINRHMKCGFSDTYKGSSIFTECLGFYDETPDVNQQYQCLVLLVQKGYNTDFSTWEFLKPERFHPLHLAVMLRVTLPSLHSYLIRDVFLPQKNMSGIQFVINNTPVASIQYFAMQWCLRSFNAMMTMYRSMGSDCVKLMMDYLGEKEMQRLFPVNPNLLRYSSYKFKPNFCKRVGVQTWKVRKWK